MVGTLVYFRGIWDKLLESGGDSDLEVSNSFADIGSITQYLLRKIDQPKTFLAQHIHRPWARSVVPWSPAMLILEERRGGGGGVTARGLVGQ